MPGTHARTGLTTTQYASALAKVREFLSHHDRITNRELRSLTGLNYDRVSKFFNMAISDGRLIRHGRAAETHYVLSPQSARPATGGPEP